MRIDHGQKAKVVGYETKGSHGFELGQIVTFVAASEDEENTYTFKSDSDFHQDLIPMEFELL